MREGQIPGSPNAITQTRDGYIWFGTEGGLLRFDGKEFDAFQPSAGMSLHSQVVVSLAAGADGSLLVGTALGLDLIRGNNVQQIGPNMQARIDQILVDAKGETWFVRARIRGDEQNPLCRLIDAGQKCVGKQEGIKTGYAVGLTEDSDGSIWIAGSTSLVRWRDGKATTYTSPKFARLENLAGIGSITAGESGKLFVGFIQAGEGLGMQEFSNGEFRTLSLPSFDGASVQTTRLYRDRNGALWIGTASEGIYRIYCGRVEHYRASDGLSGDSISDIFEDREGVVWATTTHGIDNFRDLRVRTLSTLEGLKTDFASGLVAAKDGSIWIGSMYGLNILRSGQITYLDRSKGLPGNQVMGLGQDSQGNWWIGVDQNLVYYSGGRFRTILDQHGNPLGPVTAISTGSKDQAWAIANGSHPGLLRLNAGKFVERVDGNSARMPSAVGIDSSDAVWVGYSTGSVRRFNAAHETDLSIELPSKSGVRQFVEFSQHHTLVLTQTGLYGITNGHAEQLGVRNGLPASVFKSGVVDKNGDLWLYGETALLQIKKTDLDRWWEDSTATVPSSSLNVADGLLVSDNPFAPRAVVTPDGEIWFSTGRSGVEMIAPMKQNKTRLLPPIQIQRFEADHKGYAFDGLIKLPPFTRSIQIRFAGLSFETPTDLRFRYFLDGYDKSWGDPTIDRNAYYENLKPGRYRFRVAASNQKGIWNPQNATLEFVIAPAWYQTSWFAFLVLAGVISAVTMAFRLRVRSISAQLNARFDERVAERTRMARELHDTFLQTVQGSKMVADDALVQGATEERMRIALGKLSLWLGQAVTEGRAALHALRASSTEQNPVADSLRRALDELATGSAVTDIQTIGPPRQLHPIVRDELLQVGFEAIRNASRHSGAKRIRVRLMYQGNVTLQVFDDGIGIPDEYTIQGRYGHFGLVGMRERVDRIKGRISIERRTGGGTQVSVLIPGSVAYLYPDKEALLRRLLRLFVR